MKKLPHMNDKVELTISQQLMLRELALTPIVSIQDIEFTNLICTKGFYVWSNKGYLNKLRSMYITYLRENGIKSITL